MFPEVEIGKAILSLSVATITLLLTWLVGQNLIMKWNIRQKRTEMELQLLMDMNRLHGELLEIWRVWRYQKKTRAQADLATQDSLLARTSNAEGRVEAMLSYIVSERELSDDDVKCLGLFRQACQVFRESIRNDLPMDYNYSSKEMVIFRQNFLCAIEILQRSRPYLAVSRARKSYSLARIVNTSRHDYLAALEASPMASEVTPLKKP